MQVTMVHFLGPYEFSTKLHFLQMPQMHCKIINLTKTFMD
jgi:hypothetical protein